MNQAMLLLPSLQGFSRASSVDGLKASRFEQWIRSFESILDIACCDDSKRIKLLSSKLTNLSAEALDDYLRSVSKSYAEIKKSLMERFHGHETRLMNSAEYKTCRMCNLRVTYQHESTGNTLTIKTLNPTQPTNNTHCK